MSFSKYNVNCLGDGSLFTTLPSPNALRRPRQNSVFVGSSTMAVMNPPRRVKSAIDIQHMVLSDYSPGSLSGCSSLLPMVGNNRRPSITIEKPCHRASINLDSVPLYHQPPTPKSHLRRPSCFIDNRPTIGRHHKHFISFDQPTTSWDRRTSITIDRPSSVQRPNTVFDRPCVSLEQPSLIIEPPSTSQEYPPTSIADGSSHGCCGRSCPEYMVSLHQLPSTSQARRPSFHLDIPPPASPNRHRLSVSLDHTACIKPTPSLKSPISASFDETQMKLSNLEFSKVSDV